MTTALVLVDIQNDYFPGGKMELEGSMQAGHKAGKILAYFRENETAAHPCAARVVLSGRSLFCGRDPWG